MFSVLRCYCTLPWSKRSTALPLTPHQATVAAYEVPLSPSGLFHGHGRAVFASGLAYEGSWREGRMEGEGRVAFPDGVEFRGGMRANALEGTGVSTALLFVRHARYGAAGSPGP
jgi:hypothetical protein